MANRIGTYNPKINYNKIINGHGTGLAPPTYAELLSLIDNAQIYDGVNIRSLGSLPSSLDHSSEVYFPAVGNQGDMGSCASWATAYYTNGYLQAKDNGWTSAYLGTNRSQLMSPTWVYNKINRGVDGGSSLGGNANLIASLGNAVMKTMEYNESDIYNWGDENAWRDAPRYRIVDNYDIIYPSQTLVIKSMLAEGYVIPMMLDASNYAGLGYSDNTISSAEYDHVSGRSNHANTIVGYDDSITADGDVGAFKIVNSWGKSWGSAWGGNGYYYMTYDAIAEIPWYCIRLYDKVDYDPTILAVWNQSTAGSKDSFISVSTSSCNYTNRTPEWNAGDSNFPSFMALDISEFDDGIGTDDYCLYVGSGTNASTVSYFEVEWYEKGYTPDKPTRTSGPSKDTPKTAPGRMRVFFSDVQINVTNPINGTLLNGDITISGNADNKIGRTIFKEGFEGPFTPTFIGDSNILSGSDYWNLSTTKNNKGERSAWAAGSDRGIVFQEDFNHGGSTPPGWSTYSEGPSYYPFFFTNTGYNGCGDSDYVAVANSDHSYSTDITEWLYTSTPFSPDNHKSLTLRFYIDYNYYSYDEYAQVLYATASSYPTFSNLATYTSDTKGYKQIEISSLDSESKIYLAFRYHGTYDWYMVVDDVLITGDKDTYDNDMDCYMDWNVGDLSGFDYLNLSYSYWLDSESNHDYLFVEYYTTDSKWFTTDSHSGKSNGWVSNTISIPKNTTYIGFGFTSDSSTKYAGAFIDDVELIGYIDRDDIQISIDDGPWSSTANVDNWAYVWKSAIYQDGEHTITARANYKGLLSNSSFKLNIDNTPPELSNIRNDPLTTGEDTTLYASASDIHGIGSVSVLYSINDEPEQNGTVTNFVSGVWKQKLNIPQDAVNLTYRFWAKDTLGNGKFSIMTTVPVIDNDRPIIGVDKTPTTGTTGDNLTISIIATDNIGIEKTYIDYWYGSGTHKNISADGGIFEKTITVDDTLEPLHYHFSALDTSGNWADSADKTVTITDNDKPVFGFDGTSTNATTDDVFKFKTTAKDNIAVSKVEIEYWFGPAAHTIKQMNGSSSFSFDIIIPNSLEELNYAFIATDTSNNINRTDTKTIKIIDNDPPKIVEDTSPSTANTGSKYSFLVSAVDNIAVQKVELVYWFGSGESTTQIIENNAEYTIDIPNDSLDDLNYFVIVTDTSNNNITSETKAVTIKDNQPPILGKNLSSNASTTGDEFIFSTVATDNVALVKVEVEYWIGNGAHKTARLDGNPLAFKITIPDDSTDLLQYLFIARDSSDNEIKGNIIKLEIKDNDLPTISDDTYPKIIDQWEILVFRVRTTDNIGVTQVHVIYRIGTENEQDVVMEVNGTYNTASIKFKSAGILSYRFVAKDAAGNIAQSPGATVTINKVATSGSNTNPFSQLVLFGVLFLIMLMIIIALVVALSRRNSRKGKPQLQTSPKYEPIKTRTVQNPPLPAPVSRTIKMTTPEPRREPVSIAPTPPPPPTPPYPPPTMPQAPPPNGPQVCPKCHTPGMLPFCTNCGTKIK